MIAAANLHDLFDDAEAVGDDNIHHLGSTLQEMWTARLGLLYPERRFLVSFKNDGVDAILSVRGTE